MFSFIVKAGGKSRQIALAVGATLNHREKGSSQIQEGRLQLPEVPRMERLSLILRSQYVVYQTFFVRIVF